MKKDRCCKAQNGNVTLLGFLPVKELDSLANAFFPYVRYDFVGSSLALQSFTPVNGYPCRVSSVKGNRAEELRVCTLL